MEDPRGLKKSVSRRRARSLDRSQNSKKNLESWASQRLSLPATHTRRELPCMASDGSGRPESPAQPAEPQGTMGAALNLEETKEFLPSEQRPPQDTKKDKTQRRGQQGLLKSVMNFFLRTGSEETKEKAGRKAKGKEETFESPGEPAPRKKAHDKKTRRKKHSKKHVDEETKGTQDQEAKGQETALPKTTAALRPEEADLSPAPRSREESDLHQCLLIEGGGVGVSELPSQATGHLQEEEFVKLDEETVIRNIVRLLQIAGDEWEEEQCQATQPKVAPQSPAPAPRKKSQEKRPNLRKKSHKKHGPEEPKRAGAAGVSSPDSRLPKKTGYLFLCVGGHRPSVSSSVDLEEQEAQEALPTDCGGPSSLELSPQAGSQGPEEDLQLDRDSEFKEFIQEVIALLQDAEEQEGEKQLQVQEPDVAVENLAPSCRKKSQEKKSSFRKTFSHKKHSSKEPKREGAAGAASLESRRLKRPNYLPVVCGWSHRSSISGSIDLEEPKLQESSPAEEGPAGSSAAHAQDRSHKPEGRPLLDGACDSKELIIQKLVALLQEDSHLGKQIRRHPSFRKCFYQFPDSSLKKLVATLPRQGTHSTELDRNLAERRYQFMLSLTNKFIGKNCRSVLSLTGLHYSQHCYPQFSYREAQQNITSPGIQSPD